MTMSSERLESMKRGHYIITFPLAGSIDICSLPTKNPPRPLSDRRQGGRKRREGKLVQCDEFLEIPLKKISRHFFYPELEKEHPAGPTARRDISLLVVTIALLFLPLTFMWITLPLSTTYLPDETSIVQEALHLRPVSLSLVPKPYRFTQSYWQGWWGTGYERTLGFCLSLIGPDGYHARLISLIVLFSAMVVGIFLFWKIGFESEIGVWVLYFGFSYQCFLNTHTPRPEPFIFLASMISFFWLFVNGGRILGFFAGCVIGLMTSFHLALILAATPIPILICWKIGAKSFWRQPRCVW
jgi:hypothetical protein